MQPVTETPTTLHWSSVLHLSFSLFVPQTVALSHPCSRVKSWRFDGIKPMLEEIEIISSQRYSPWVVRENPYKIIAVRSESCNKPWKHPCSMQHPIQICCRQLEVRVCYQSGLVRSFPKRWWPSTKPIHDYISLPAAVTRRAPHPHPPHSPGGLASGGREPQTPCR